MSKSKISIQLKDDLKVYFPGQTICGNVILDLDEAMDLKSVSIQFLGIVKVDFKFGSQTNSYKASEEIFNFLVDLHDPGAKTLPAGVTTFPFTFKLPIEIPSSFNSPTGRVIYAMIPRLTRAWYKFDLETVCLFHVIGIVDLNSLEEGHGESINLSEQKPLGMMCCKNGSLQFKVSYPRTGYVPGESLSLTAEMTNQSSKDIRSKFSLIMETTVFAEERNYIHQQHICSSMGPAVKPGQIEMWIGQEIMTIPPVPPTNLGECSIIKLRYFLRFEMFNAAEYINFTSNTPIVIGSIPLRSMFSSLSARVKSKEPSVEGDTAIGDEISRKPRIRALDPIPSPSILSIAPVFAAYPDLPPFIFAKSIVRTSTKLETLFQTNWQMVKTGDGEIQPYDEHDDVDEEHFNSSYIYYKR